MGSTDITGTKSAGSPMDESWYNDFRSALIGALLPRAASSGAVASGSDLGSGTYPWGTIYGNTLNIGGQVVDFGNLTGVTNSITSGAVRSTSDYPDFLRAAGSSASFDLLATTTDLVVNINGTSVTVSSDITEGSLTVAPSSNNTATINDASLTDQKSSKWQGEDGTTITISSAGTEITSRVGQWCAFKKDTEYFLAYIKSATELTNAYRGFFFDDSGDPINRVTLANSDTITIMSTAWVFIESDATTVDVTYNTPIYAMTAPTSPTTGDYWYDLVNDVWKRYNGASFVQIDRTLIGVAVIDSTNCVATRSFNFSNSFEANQPIKLDYVSATQIKAANQDFDLSVYGLTVQNRFTDYTWDISIDLESGQTEGASTTYFIYITQQAEKILSDIKPYDQRAELKGWYHPYNAWRCVGYIFNDGSSNFQANTIYNYYNDGQLELDEEALTNLKALGKTTSASDTLPYFNGSGTATTTTLTSFARTLLDDGNATTARSTIGADGNYQQFTSSGTWNKPSNKDNNAAVLVECWGGGGGGVRQLTGRGGGGGSYAHRWFRLSELSSSVTVTVGAGGAGGIGSPSTAPTAGGTSSFGSLVTAYGGGAGDTTDGGSGGGLFATGGTPSNDLDSTTDEGQGIGGGNAAATNGYYIGGGGGGDGGKSVYGGGGGGGDGGSAGTSIYGGDGGTSDIADDGDAPSGGGGNGSNGSNGGNGARGEVRITVFA